MSRAEIKQYVVDDVEFWADEAQVFAEKAALARELLDAAGPGDRAMWEQVLAGLLQWESEARANACREVLA